MNPVYDMFPQDPKDRNTVLFFAALLIALSIFVIVNFNK